MATHHGREGTVKVGANLVASVSSWTYDESIDQVEATALGDVAKSYVSGLPDGSGSLTCFWEEDDTNGQQVLEDAKTSGTPVTLNIYPEGEETGDIFYSGDVTIESYGINGGTSDLTGATYNFKGFLARSTVA